MGVRTANVQPGNIGETLEGLAATIHARRDASPQESYTARLLTDVEDELLKKLAEEASEIIMACKDRDHDHIRYEAGDLVYHLLVTLERYGISLDELAGELNARMKQPRHSPAGVQASAQSKKGPRRAAEAQGQCSEDYLQSDRAASSAMTTQLGCSCRIEAGQEGWMGPKHMSCTAWAFFSPLAITSTM